MIDSPLGPRLALIAALVPAPCRVADIGADHGQLSVRLAQAGCAVIAVEAVPGPLAQLTATLRCHPRAAARIEPRLGDGLGPVQPGEVEAICIAGMGGTTIAGILQRGAAVAQQARRLVLQPMNGTRQLRLALLDLGLELVEERMVEDAGRRYEVWAAAPGDAERPYRSCPAPREAALLIGPHLVAANDPLTVRCWAERLGALRAQEARIQRGADAAAALARTREEMEAVATFLDNAAAWASRPAPSTAEPQA
jgi:tRNA (adenine22-N1)-methyltransferase